MSIHRRDFLSGASLALAGAALSSGNTLNPMLNPDFETALDAGAAIRAKQVSSVELTGRMFARIERYNPKLNAFVFQTRDRAMAQARAADRAIASGAGGGPLLGVPFCVKECFRVQGEPDTWGIPALKDTKAPENSTVVNRLLAAGAVLTGGTNVPFMLMDWQTYNDIYGTTNNPWDLTRTPGGSSGGSAAAVAAGLTYLSVGSDIGGSLRVPASFCGVYSHKPTLDLVSMLGINPGTNRAVPGFSTGLAVAGPIARSAADLKAALEILGGPDAYDRKAWTWKLPQPRQRSIKNFRVGYVFDSPLAPLTPEVKTLLDRTLTTLDHAGVQLKSGWAPGYDLEKAMNSYLYLLAAFNFAQEDEHTQEIERRQFQQAPRGSNPFAAGALSSYADWLTENSKKLAARAAWQAYFDQIDVFLMPVAFTPAIHHDHQGDMTTRTIDTPQGKRPYMQLMPWMVTATYTGCPATTAPMGLTGSGLPAGLQIMGPYGEDATPIEFARLLAAEIGGFQPPPGYNA